MRQENLKVTIDKLNVEHLLRKRKVIDSAQDVRIKIAGTSSDQTFINFTSNDYLGLANHPTIKAALIAGAEKYGVGSGASHLICGHQTPHHELELAFADFFNTEKALLFSSGFMANLGIIDALCPRDTLLLQDKLNHASLIDAGRLARSEFKRYPHNNLAHLQDSLEKSQTQDILIASDSVFSMDGDLAHIQDLSQLSKKYNASLLLDEAHGFGVLGQNGKGAADTVGKLAQSPIIMAPLGKALGTYGAVVAGSADLIEYLIQKSRAYAYTTALPASIAHASLAALKLLQQANEQRAHLSQLIECFQKNMQSINVNLLRSNTPIQPILLGENATALDLAEKLYAKSILVQAIRPPTVPAGTARIRITFCANHTLEDVDKLSSAIQSAL